MIGVATNSLSMIRLSSDKDNYMPSRLSYFDMPAFFKSIEEAEKFIPTFKDVLETMGEPLSELDAWSTRNLKRNKRKASRQSMQDSGIFFALFYVLSFHLKNVTIKRY